MAITPVAGVVAASADWSLAWQGTNNADGLVAQPDGGILFAQEQPAQVGRLSPADEYSVYLRETRGVGALAVDRAGRLWGVERSCTDPGRRADGPCNVPTAIARLTPERKVLADSVAGQPLGRLNDLAVDRHGGAYFTVGGAYYARPDGSVVAVGRNLQTNGVALSADETRLYVTNRETVVVFDIGPGGTATNQREFARLDAGGVGDGLAIDDTGRLYVTSGPGVQVFDDDGRYLGLIPTPRPVISAAFAGVDRRTLYVVGSGAALGPGGSEFTTPAGVRNNAKTIYRMTVLAGGARQPAD